ncbi:SUN domain-containing protein 3 [Anabrus simplex]|uniref:SUN domain-containing protein 3 n=1 Tax=Anabrus simplex TaxID=316456 RepID=UPI0035A2A1A8
MAARTRGLKSKDDKENSNFIPSTVAEASSIRKNCQRCFREIIGGTNDVQSRLNFERSSTSSPQLYVQPMDPGLNSRNGMVTPTYHLRARIPRSTPEPKFASSASIIRSNTAVRNASKETQTGGDSAKQEKTLILECGLDLDHNYTLTSDLNPSAEEKSLTGHLKKWSLPIAVIVFTASISYILGMYTCQEKPENHLMLPYNPPPNVERLKLERNQDINQLKDLVSNLQEKLSVKMDIYSHQYNILREKMQTISDAVNSIKGNVQNHNSRSTDLNNVCAKKLVEEISTYDADKMGIADYALESSGGSILSTPDTKLYSFDSWITIWNIPLWATQRSARNIIQASVHPGDCWAFAGSTGSVIIRLAMPVYITAVTMEHIPPSISPTGNIRSAPKAFLLFGLEETYDTEGIQLGRFTYTVPGTPLQTFIITDQAIEKRIPFKAVQLKILTNHGNKEFTCVYRFRVHGKPTSETGFVTS